MAKDILYGEEARQKLIAGVEKLARAVGVTMGPMGKCVVLSPSAGIGAPVATKDGVTVARQIILEDPAEELGCQLVKEAAGRSADIAGDGTTTATVLTHEILCQGTSSLTSEKSILNFKRGMEWALQQILTELDRHTIATNGFEDLKNIATISANNDVELGTVIAEAYHAVGDNGLVTANAFPGIKTQMKVLDGIEIPSGYMSRALLDNNENEWSAENCHIMIFNREVTHLAEASELLNQISTKNRPLLIICKSLKKEAAQILFENNSRGRIKVCAVKLPVFKGSPHQHMWLEDLAILTGTKIIDEENGIPLSEFKYSDLGFARQITVDISTTKIIESKRQENAIKSRLKTYSEDLNKLLGEKERRDVQDRMAFLGSKAAVITVGYSTELELREKGDRIEDAMCAVRAAKESGYLPGGGVALLKASKMINLDSLPASQHCGAKALLRSCERPIRQILNNAGEDTDTIINNILANSDFDFGYNVDSGEYGSLIKMGVIDPQKVTKSALQNATTIAIVLLSTETVVSEMTHNPSAWQPPAGYRFPGSNASFNHKY